MQEKAGVDEPDYGIVLDDMVFASPVVRPRSAYLHPKIEAELAFVLRDDVLDARLAAIEEAIDYVVPAMELVDNRYPDYRMGIVDTIADNAACAGLVTGSVRMPYGAVELADVEMILYRGDEEITRGTGVNVMNVRSTRSSGSPRPPCASGRPCGRARSCSRDRSVSSWTGMPASPIRRGTRTASGDRRPPGGG